MGNGSTPRVGVDYFADEHKLGRLSLQFYVSSFTDVSYLPENVNFIYHCGSQKNDDTSKI